MTASRLSSFAGALADAWRSGTFAARIPDFDVRTVQEAFAVQAGVVAALGEDIPGWKLGFAADGTPVGAPLLARTFRRSGARMERPRNQPLRIELEIAFRLARDLPARGVPYTREEVLAAVSEVVVGIETLAFRIDPAAPPPFPLLVADNLANEGYVVGDATAAFRSLDLNALRSRLDVDGTPVHEGRGGHPQNDPVEPLRAWASAPPHPLGALRAGQVVTTGSITPPLALERSARLRGTVEGIGEVTLDLA